MRVQSRAKKRQNIGSEVYDDPAYQSRLGLYRIVPQETISLGEFESLARDRLNLLQVSALALREKEKRAIFFSAWQPSLGASCVSVCAVSLFVSARGVFGPSGYQLGRQRRKKKGEKKKGVKKRAKCAAGR